MGCETTVDFPVLFRTTLGSQEELDKAWEEFLSSLDPEAAQDLRKYEFSYGEYGEGLVEVDCEDHFSKHYHLSSLAEFIASILMPGETVLLTKGDGKEVGGHLAVKTKDGRTAVYFVQYAAEVHTNLGSGGMYVPIYVMDEMVREGVLPQGLLSAYYLVLVSGCIEPETIGGPFYRPSDFPEEVIEEMAGKMVEALKKTSYDEEDDVFFVLEVPFDPHKKPVLHPFSGGMGDRIREELEG